VSQSATWDALLIVSDSRHDPTVFDPVVAAQLSAEVDEDLPQWVRRSRFVYAHQGMMGVRSGYGAQRMLEWVPAYGADRKLISPFYGVDRSVAPDYLYGMTLASAVDEIDDTGGEPG
jgi:hypothetical protein